MAFFILLFGLPAILIFLDFLFYIIDEKSMLGIEVRRAIELIVMIIAPIFYLNIDEDKNNCCGESATFSPEHIATTYVLIVICVAGYLYSAFRKGVGSPVLEVILNTCLLLGLIFNIFIAIQIGNAIWLFGNLPIGLTFIRELSVNHKLFLKNHIEAASVPTKTLQKLAWKFLHLNIFIKIPVLLVLCIPLLTIISCFLLLFGQKPDSAIRMFTDTYKHGLSQLDYLCENVKCGDHFLCSVAANGHATIVKPVRYGERGGKKIICNRQLLVSNAFEELIQQKLPFAHKIIRHNYNKVGNVVHRYYKVFQNKYISDIVFVLMKPLELIFLVALYSFDKSPENRIARQYLKTADRLKLEKNN